MKETLEIKKRFINWFSGLALEVMIKAEIQDRTSNILGELQGIKDHVGNQCKWSPCSKHQYSRGVCSRHYAQLQQLRTLTKTPWSDFAKIGLCNFSHFEISSAYKASEPRKDDPLRILIKNKSHDHQLTAAV